MRLVLVLNMLSSLNKDVIIIIIIIKQKIQRQTLHVFQSCLYCEGKVSYC